MTNQRRIRSLGLAATSLLLAISVSFPAPASASVRSLHLDAPIHAHAIPIAGGKWKVSWGPAHAPGPVLSIFYNVFVTSTTSLRNETTKVTSVIATDHDQWVSVSEVARYRTHQGAVKVFNSAAAVVWLGSPSSLVTNAFGATPQTWPGANGAHQSPQLMLWARQSLTGLEETGTQSGPMIGATQIGQAVQDQTSLAAAQSDIISMWQATTTHPHPFPLPGKGWVYGVAATTNSSGTIDLVLIYAHASQL